MPFDASEENNARARLIRLRDFLAGLPAERFSMNTLGDVDGAWNPDLQAQALHGCGTAACIAGWACALYAPAVTLFEADDVAGFVLGLEHSLARELFYPWDSQSIEIDWAEASLITPDQAVRVLDWLIATGQVDWAKAFEDAPAETVKA
jgi:hypothetical protein